MLKLILSFTVINVDTIFKTIGEETKDLKLLTHVQEGYQLLLLVLHNLFHPERIRSEIIKQIVSFSFKYIILYFYTFSIAIFIAVHFSSSLGATLVYLSFIGIKFHFLLVT